MASEDGNSNIRYIFDITKMTGIISASLASNEADEVKQKNMYK